MLSSGSKSSTPCSLSPTAVLMPRIEERKCCSYNDIPKVLGLAKEPIVDGSAMSSSKRRLQSAKIQRDKSVPSNFYTDSTKLSNYFGTNIPPPNSKNSTHAKIEITTSPINEGHTQPRTNDEDEAKRSNEQAFHIFNLNKSFRAKTPAKVSNAMLTKYTGNELRNFSHSSCVQCVPLPVHPVARPNLAAILRTQHSQRKLKEFEKNCAYSEWRKCSSLDWEVRKTDAWKALLLRWVRLFNWLQLIMNL